MRVNRWPMPSSLLVQGAGDEVNRVRAVDDLGCFFVASCPSPPMLCTIPFVAKKELDMILNTLKRFMVWLLIASTCNLAQFVSANAALVSTDQLANAARVRQGRDKLNSFLRRADVRSQLEQLGVDPTAAQWRADAMTDEEIEGVSGKLDQLPAGGDILGAIVFIFVLLLITDILGLTKIFPFTRPIR
jgi:uncharacterized protein DUF6627